MAITMTKDPGGFQVGGGNLLYIMEVNSDGSALGTPDTWHSAAHLMSSKHIDKDSVKTKTLEDNSVSKSRGQREVGMEGVFAQNDKATLAFKEETRGKFYKVYYQDGATANAKVKEYLYAICQFFMDQDAERKGDADVEPKWSMVCNKNAAAVANANNTLPSVKKTASAMDVAAGAYYFVAET